MRLFEKLRGKAYSPTGRVLEVGCGRNPAPESSVLIDLDPKAIAYLKAKGKEAIVATGATIPFGDSSFDYATCMHTAEHLEQEEIQLLFSELARVAPKGYLEVPSIFWELLHNGDKGIYPEEYTNDHHKQYCFLDQGVLCFVRKDDKEYDVRHKILGVLFNNLLKNETVYKNIDLYMIGIAWSKTIKVRFYRSMQEVPTDVIGRLCAQVVAYAKTKKGEIGLARRVYRKLKSIIRR